MARIEITGRFVAGVTWVCAAAILVAGCGGGGGGNGGGGAAGVVVATSFQGFPAAPGGSPPPVFRDEAQFITFSGIIDPTNFGGFVTPMGQTQPTVFVGVSATNLQGVPYHAFVDQAAARASFQVWNDGTMQQVMNGIIGRSVVDPRTLVFDPKVPAGNPFNLTPSLGLDANTQYDVFIPANNALIVGGAPAAAYGATPQVPQPMFTPSPGPSTIFVTGPAFAPDTVPPRILDITTEFLNGADPTQNPIPDNDTIRVTFSEPIDVGSINTQKNLIIRNLSVTTSVDPNGVLVPTNRTMDATNTIFFFTPVPSFGAGPYTIRVEVGTNADSQFDILDLPAGAQATQNPLANSLIVDFTTVPNPNALTAASIQEDFETNNFEDTSFMPRYNPADWNVNASGRLSGITISGSAQPGQALGTRMQFSMQPTGPGTPATLAFFSPFDDNMLNNLGMGVNPNGGSHTQLLYLVNGMELPQNLANSIELVEWGVASGFSNMGLYPGFRMMMGHSTADAANANSVGIVPNYDSNFDFDNPQNEFINPAIHPATQAGIMGFTPNESPVVVRAMADYMAPLLASTFIPYPTLDLPFDFDRNRMEVPQSNPTGNPLPPNLVVDINIQPPVQPSNNFILGNNPTAPNPTRRVLGPSGATLANVNDAVAYHTRFTIVDKNSSAQSLFFDLGGPAQDADFTVLNIVPDVATRPPNTVIIVRVEAADAIMNGMPVNDPNGSPPTGLITYIDRAGNVIAGALDLLDNRRFFRIRFDFENDVTTNTSPFVEGWILGYQF